MDNPVLFYLTVPGRAHSPGIQMIPSPSPRPTTATCLQLRHCIVFLASFFSLGLSSFFIEPTPSYDATKCQRSQSVFIASFKSHRNSDSKRIIKYKLRIEPSSGNRRTSVTTRFLLKHLINWFKYKFLKDCNRFF